MFEAALKAICERSFMPKATFDAPDYSAPEQDTLFIEVLDSSSKVTKVNGGRAICRVKGNFVCFSQGTRLPYGFFVKAVNRAKTEDVKNLFIEREIDVVDSPARLVNIHERRCGFTFLFDTQFDPDQGELTSMEIT